jgi:hypothetical protein
VELPPQALYTIRLGWQRFEQLGDNPLPNWRRPGDGRGGMAYDGSAEPASGFRQAI